MSAAGIARAKVSCSSGWLSLAAISSCGSPVCFSAVTSSCGSPAGLSAVTSCVCPVCSVSPCSLSEISFTRPCPEFISVGSFSDSASARSCPGNPSDIPSSVTSPIRSCSETSAVCPAASPRRSCSETSTVLSTCSASGK